MKVGIMQPYIFPYIGYWQLLNAVDKFVIYDNIQFTKNGWVRRNRILLNGNDKLFTLPIKKDSDYLDIRDRYLADTFPKEREKLLSQIKMGYKKAPYFNDVYPILEECINYDNNNLFEYIYHSIVRISTYLKINTELIISSDIEMNHSLKNKDRVIETCKTLGSSTYINPVGGIELYDKEYFSNNDIDLKLIKTQNFEYEQYNNQFIPNLSIIDVLMFNSNDEVKKLLGKYELL